MPLVKLYLSLSIVASKNTMKEKYFLLTIHSNTKDYYKTGIELDFRLRGAKHMLKKFLDL